MSERHGWEERKRRETEDRFGPSMDAEGHRKDDLSKAEGPRPVGEAREDRERRGGERREERGGQGTRHRADGEQGGDAERGTSWLSVIFGCLSRPSGPA